jgi:hypothetical protein
MTETEIAGTELMSDVLPPERLARWHKALARRVGVADRDVLDAISEVTGSAPILLDVFWRDEVIPELAAMTYDQACEVITRVQEARRRIVAERKTHCQGCGLPFDNDDRECWQCS